MEVEDRIQAIADRLNKCANCKDTNHVECEFKTIGGAYSICKAKMVKAMGEECRNIIASLREE